MRWHESWIVRAALMASFILFLGFSVSAFFAFQSIDGVAKLAHDDEIEASLGAHLEFIKRAHALEQQLIATHLQRVTAPAPKDTGEAVVRQWLEAAGIDKFAPLGQIRLTRLAESGLPSPTPTGDVAWLDRENLKIRGWVATFPRGSTYEAFKAAEDVRQRYQLLGLKLEEDIKPTLIRASTWVLVVSFVLLASLFFVYAQRFKARTGDVIEGFQIWSERDTKFRFANLYKGELRLITHQFNVMADEVEESRQRNLYLEKIASWQIIARKLAHEIKNPLTPIQMMVSQLKRRYKGDDEAFAKLLGEAQAIITEEVAGLRRMVDTFSNFARLPEPDPKLVDLVPLCQHVVELQKNAFPHHTLSFQSKLEAAPATVDDDLLRQVLLNLIKNAGEAAGETPAAVTVGIDGRGEDWLLTVRDTGPGIPLELTARIFEAYFTTKHTGPSPGMGLGLAVCQKIVMDHGGKLSVKSRPGETVFTVQLPKRRK